MREFKVGDEVRIIKRLGDNTYGGCDFDKPNGDVGRVGKISRCYKDSGWKVRDREDYLGIFDLEELELINNTQTTTKLIPQNCIIYSNDSKEDWDKLIDYLFDNGYNKTDSDSKENWKDYYTKGRDTSVNMIDGKLDGYTTKKWYQNSSMYKDYKFIDIRNIVGGKEIQESKPSHKFEIGDRVKRINKEHCNIKVGDVCEIIKAHSYGNIIIKRLFDGYSVGSHDGKNLELVKDIEDNPKSTHKFKVGDRVRRIKYFGGGDNKHHDMEIGDEDVITELTELIGTVMSLEKFGTGHSQSCFELVGQNEVINNKGFSPDGIKNNSSKTSIMDTLKKIPSTLKRIIDKDLQAMYKVEFINGDLALTEKGEKELLNHLISVSANKKAMSDIAREIIKEEKENR